jgi:HEAT repeat protein
VSDQSETNHIGSLNQRDLWLRGDNRSTEDLVRTALAELREGVDTRGANDVAAYVLDVADEEHESIPRPSQALAALQSRGTREVFKIACALCTSQDPLERILGATILGQNLVAEKNFPDEKMEVLSEMLTIETEPNVISAICYALGHIGDERVVRYVLPFSTHPDDEVRRSVVQALLHQEDDMAVHALIELSNDNVDEVRDWATFGLGNMTEVDTPELRGALVARLDDPDEDTRWEAAAGLGRRGDQRSLERLQEAFEEGWASFGALEAATILAHPALLPALLGLREEGRDSELLEEAIEACSRADQSQA